MSGTDDERVRALEERVARLERLVEALRKRSAPAQPRGGGRDYRDRYDALDYPER